MILDLDLIIFQILLVSFKNILWKL